MQRITDGGYDTHARLGSISPERRESFVTHSEGFVNARRLGASAASESSPTKLPRSPASEDNWSASGHGGENFHESPLLIVACQSALL